MAPIVAVNPMSEELPATVPVAKRRPQPVIDVTRNAVAAVLAAISTVGERSARDGFLREMDLPSRVD